MRKITLSLILNVLLIVTVSAQAINFGSVWDEQLLMHRVKQVGEFMDRFNYERDIANKPIEDKDDTVKRKRYVFSLFDAQLVLNSSNPDSTFYEIEQFVDVIVNSQQPVYLYFNDTTWTAEAVCQTKYKGKSTKISVFLKTEEIADNQYKWIISDARGSMLDITPKLKRTKYMISPVENELEFMNLPDISNIYKKDVIHYSDKSFRFDRLSVFFALIYNDMLKVEAVERVIYHFRQVSGYEFTVENIERASKNAGWLISSLRIIDKEEEE
jgi:hypothetical protein